MKIGSTHHRTCRTMPAGRTGHEMPLQVEPPFQLGTGAAPESREQVNSTPAVRTATAQVAQFIEDRLERVSPINERGVLNPAAIIHGEPLYATYRAWWASLDKATIPLNWGELTLTGFGRAAGKFLPKQRGNEGVEYRGVRVRA